MEFEANKTNAFIDLFKEKIQVITEELKNRTDQLERNNFEIEKFYLEEDLFASEQQITITKLESDAIINRKIARYNIIMSLLLEKKEIIKTRLQQGYYTDPMDKVNFKIALMRLQTEIISKKQFIDHLKTRKNVK